MKMPIEITELECDHPARRGGSSPLFLSLSRRRACVGHVMTELRSFERQACQAPGHHRSTQRRARTMADDEELLTADIIELARHYGRLRLSPGHSPASPGRTGGEKEKRVERIWQRERNKMPAKQPKRVR